MPKSMKRKITQLEFSEEDEVSPSPPARSVIVEDGSIRIYGVKEGALIGESAPRLDAKATRRRPATIDCDQNSR